MFCWSLPLRGPNVYHVPVAVGPQLFTFGGPVGYCGVLPTCVYVLNTVALRWTALPEVETSIEIEWPPEVPRVRTGHSAVLVEGGVVYIWGRRNSSDNRLYAFDVDTRTWLKTEEASGSVPPARWDHAACAIGKLMYVHGGWDPTRLTDDMYRVDTSTLVWSLVSTTRGAQPPPATCSHSATIIGTKMFVFGGAGHHLDIFPLDVRDVRVFDTESDLWLSSSEGTTAGFPPGQQDAHTAFAHNGQLYVFPAARCVTGNTFKGLWRFNTGKSSWTKVEPKGRGGGPCTSGTDMRCCVASGDRLFLFYCTHTYILDLSPRLKSFCKLAVIEHGMERSQLPHDLQWELATMTSGGNWHEVSEGDMFVSRALPTHTDMTGATFTDDIDIFSIIPGAIEPGIIDKYRRRFLYYSNNCSDSDSDRL